MATLYGKIVIIKKKGGGDGTNYPLTATSCLFGRAEECDIRIQLPNVSDKHCRLEVNQNGEVFLTNLSNVNPTLINGKILPNNTNKLNHKDVFTIDRSFRFEFPPGSPYRNSPTKGTPVKISTPTKVLTPLAKSANVQTKTVSPVKSVPIQKVMPFVQPEGAPITSSIVEHTGDSTSSTKILTPKKKYQTPTKTTTPVNDPTPHKVLTPKQKLLTPQIAQRTDPKTLSPSKTPGRKSEQLSSPQVARKTPGKIKILTPKAKPPKPVGVQSAKKIHSVSPVASPAKRSRSLSPTGLKKTARSPRKSLSQPPASNTTAMIASVASSPAVGEAYRKGQSGKKMSPFGSPRAPSKTPLKTGITKLRRESDPVEELDESESPKPSTPQSAKKKLSMRGSSGRSQKRKTPDTTVTSPVANKRGRVFFGPQLSPEQFDKALPPLTPVKRGSVPRRSLGVQPTSTPLMKKNKRHSVAVPQHTMIREESPASSKRKSPASKTTPTSSPQSKTPKKSNLKTPKGTPAISVKSPQASSSSPAAKTPKKSTPSKSPNSRKSPKTTPKTSEKSTPVKSPNRKSPKSTPKTSPKKSLKSKDSPITKTPDKPKSPKNQSPKVRAAAKTPTPKKTPASSRKTSTKKKVIASKVTTKTARGRPSIGSGKANRRKSAPLPNENTKSKVTKKTRKSMSAIDKVDGPASIPKILKAKTASKSPKNRVTPKALKALVPKGKSPGVTDFESPPIDIKKAVAVRAILGKAATPKLTPAMKKQASIVHAASAKKIRTSSAKKTPARVPAKSKTPKQSWSQIVRKGVAAQKAVTVKKKYVQQKAARVVKKTAQKSRVMPKTPRTKMAMNEVKTTGHAESPVTLIIRKKIAKTPKPLPKKGQKQPLNANANDDAETSFTGLTDMMKTPATKLVTEDHSLYDDIPDTPKSPGEMIVSPSVSSTKKKPEDDIVYSGTKRLFKTPRQKSEAKSPTVGAINRLFATPKTKKPLQSPATGALSKMFASPRTRVIPSSPDGEAISTMFMSPSPVKRKRDSNVGMSSSKKVKLTPESSKKIRTPTKSTSKSPRRKSKSPNKLIVKIPSPAKSPVKADSSIQVQGSSQKRKSSTPAEQSPVKKILKLDADATNVVVQENLNLPENVDMPSQTEPSPVKPRGRRGKAVATEEKSPVKPRPSRRGRAAAVEMPVQEETTVKPTRGCRGQKSQAVTDEEPVEQTPVKPARGHKGKAVETSEEPAKPTPVKPARGRRGKVVETSEEPAEPTPVKPARGRRGKAVETGEEPAEPTPVKPARGRRGKAVETGEEPAEPTPVKPARGRRGKAVETSEVPAEPTPVKPARGRKGKAVETGEVPAEPTPVKPARGRKGKAVETSEEPAEPTPVKPARGRRGKVVETSEEPAEPTPIKPARGRRGKAVETSEEPAEPTPIKPARGRRGKAVETSEEPAEPTPVKLARGRRGKAVETGEVPAEPTPVKPARGRRGKAVETGEVPAEPTPVKPARGRRGKVVETREEPAESKATRGKAVMVTEAPASPEKKVTPIKPTRGRKAKVVETVEKLSPVKPKSRRGKAVVVETTAEEETTSKPTRGRRLKKVVAEEPETTVEESAQTKSTGRRGKSAAVKRANSPVAETSEEESPKKRSRTARAKKETVATKSPVAQRTTRSRKK
ncbi:uncharacterized protein LOC141899563 [Tubulanus polymorphus]|uniref:uncharacterized protein LOC141899563 n=1 Tax=Tubulanus polymorphus TaxID=672921 RepID=UPI003DA637A2